MNRIFKVKYFVICGGLSLVMVLLYFWNYANNNVAVFIPLSRSDLVFRDGNVDISIQRVEELHLHQEERKPIPRTRAETIPLSAITHKAQPSQVKAYLQQNWNKTVGWSGNQDAEVEDYSHQHDRFDSSMKGKLNYDIWHWVVGFLVDDLRMCREFPSHPDERVTISQLHNHFDEVDPADVKGHYGHKMYGYLIPPEPGIYSFKVELTQLTAAASVELWISTDADPLSIQRILSVIHVDMPLVQDNNQSTNTSHPTKKVEITISRESVIVSLDSNVHYFEFLEKAYNGKIIADVKWKTPSSGIYVPIPSSALAMAIKLDGHNYPLEGPATHILDGPLPSNHLQMHHPIYSVWNVIYPITDLPILPQCEFTALYARRRRIRAYHGIYQVHESKVAPQDKSWFKHWQKDDKGNSVIDQKVVNKVVAAYTNALKASRTVKGEVIGLRSLEETTNKDDGSRFLLEMDIQLYEPHEEIVHTSEYVYLKKGSSNLCHTSNFQWTKNVDVHFVVAVKNLGLWVKHLIYNMEDIYEQTRDDHFSLIIVDYESQDMDIKEEVKKSSFKRIEVLSLKGKFSRSGGLQAGINSVKDKDSIIMTIDMHLTLPIGMVEYIRRHTVQYKMAFTPMFFRLNKGYTEININGFWETLTYGLFSMYKSDWLKFGGFNTRKFRSKWGGEDWDVLDRSLAKGFEAFRIRPPGLVHYHHTRKGMWGNRAVNINKKWTLDSGG